MKLKAAFLLTFVLFFSFLTAGNAVLTEESRIIIVSEHQVSTDQSFDDLEMYSEMMTLIDVSLPPILYMTEATAVSSIAFNLLEPPKFSSFIS